MAQKKEDEIMAEYLLKGGKMLEKTCRQCGCPQFEYKGNTFCVVCAERGQEKKAGETRTAPLPSLDPGTGTSSEGAGIGPELAATILDLCRRIKEEEDPDRCLVLMDAVKIGAEALQILRQL